MPALLVTLLPYLVPIVAPLVVAGVKAVTPKIPKPLLPFLSIAVGALSALAGDVTLGQGVALGAAGIGVREVLDQVKQAVGAK